MNEHPAPFEPEPLEPETLDELLSAELDGELAAAARDLGLSVDEATARLGATPNVDARRVALGAARDLLGVTPEIEDLLAGRLRAKAVRVVDEANAMRAADRRRRRRLLVSASGIAAAAVAVVAGAAALNAGHSASTASARPPQPAAAALTPSSHGTPAAVRRARPLRRRARARARRRGRVDPPRRHDRQRHDAQRPGERVRPERDGLDAGAAGHRAPSATP